MGWSGEHHQWETVVDFVLIWNRRHRFLIATITSLQRLGRGDHGKEENCRADE
jgi:hypothetical protein